MLMEPERRPKRFAEDKRLGRIAPLQRVEERLLEALPEEPFGIGLRQRQRRPASIADKVSLLTEREDDSIRHAALAGEETNSKTLGSPDRDPAFLDHRV